MKAIEIAKDIAEKDTEYQNVTKESNRISCKKKKHYWDVTSEINKTVCGIKTFYKNGERNVHIAKHWDFVTCRKCLSQRYYRYPKNKSFDFWKAAEEARKVVETWPDWKKDIQLTEYSTGLLKTKVREKNG